MSGKRESFGVGNFLGDWMRSEPTIHSMRKQAKKHRAKTSRRVGKALTKGEVD